MTKGSNFWVIGGEFGSMNFHKLVEGSAQVQGPFKTRKEAEDAWQHGLGREPPQGRRPLLDRGRAVASRVSLGLSGYRRSKKTSKDGAAPSGICRVGPSAFGTASSWPMDGVSHWK